MRKHFNNFISPRFLGERKRKLAWAAHPGEFKPQTGHTSPGVQEEETLAAGGTAGTDECNGKA